jgi:hypothetical protein
MSFSFRWAQVNLEIRRQEEDEESLDNPDPKNPPRNQNPKHELLQI